MVYPVISLNPDNPGSDISKNTNYNSAKR